MRSQCTLRCDGRMGIQIKSVQAFVATYTYFHLRVKYELITEVLSSSVNF